MTVSGVDNLFRKASAFHQQGRFAEAEKLYMKILARSPGFLPALNMHGILSAQKGDFQGAAALFGKAIEVDPTDPSPRENLAKALMRMGQYEQAQAVYNDVLKLAPGSYTSLFGMGRALQSQGEYEEALTVFSRAERMNGRDPSLYLNMGLICQQLERMPAALAWYHKALAVDPASVDACVCLGHLLLQQQSYEDAGKYFSQAIAAGAKRADVEFGYAQVLEHRGDEQSARDHYFRAVELDPGSQNAYIQLDQFLLKSGGREKQAFLEELAGDYIYGDWRESLTDLRRLADMYDYPDARAVRALHDFMDDYDPGELHDRHWWQQHLDAFGGVNKGHDKLLRSVHSAVYCWSLPDRQTLTEVADFVGETRLCSYGAGSGVWECLLQQHFDVEVTASDYNLRHRFIPMAKVDYSVAEVNPTDTVFLAWVLRGDLAIMNILEQMQSGQKLILVGEPPDSEGVPRICATPEMWSLLGEAFSVTRTIPLVSYSLLNDTASLFVKN